MKINFGWFMFFTFLPVIALAISSVYISIVEWYKQNR